MYLTKEIKWQIKTKLYELEKLVVKRCESDPINKNEFDDKIDLVYLDVERILNE